MDDNAQNDLLAARKSFGKIVRSLRTDQIDENLRGWTQAKLAQETGLSEAVVRNIEAGKKAKLPEDILLALADAFNLTSAERKQFFMAAIDVERHKVPQASSTPEETLQHLYSYIAGTRLPAYINDSYCDVIYANRIIADLLRMEELETTGSTIPAGYNMGRVVFHDQYGYRQLMGDDWDRHAVYNVRYFRERTLASRHEEYFEELLKYLIRKVLHFRAYWQGLQSGEEKYLSADYFSGHLAYDYEHPGLGRLQYMATETVTITSLGALSTVIYVPKDEHTTQEFENIAERVGTEFIELASWPDKTSLLKQLRG
ncbi:MAG: helix-turn-helix domain-containing protein [Caldilineaceae bacterium]|nr:helix-turn-helix domain-containing protein [Caldilineaceae bacterium]